MAMREAALHAALDDMIAWLRKPEAQVAVFDATNSTEDRRNKLVRRLGDKGFRAHESGGTGLPGGGGLQGAGRRIQAAV